MALGYQSVLARGFAIVRSADGAMVRSAGAVQAGDRISLELRDGRIDAGVEGAHRKGEPAPPTDRAASPNPGVRAPRKPRTDQGSLF
jgi:exodeoxyribonuclease VII large subunit